MFHFYKYELTYNTSRLPRVRESLYHALDADANEIADGLFLGAAKAASDKAAMKKRKISHAAVDVLRKAELSR